MQYIPYVRSKIPYNAQIEKKSGYESMEVRDECGKGEKLQPVY
jgi:hypothetical protein